MTRAGERMQALGLVDGDAASVGHAISAEESRDRIDAARAHSGAGARLLKFDKTMQEQVAAKPKASAHARNQQKRVQNRRETPSCTRHAPGVHYDACVTLKGSPVEGAVVGDDNRHLQKE